MPKDNMIRARLDPDTYRRWNNLMNRLKLNPDDYGVESTIIKFCIRFTEEEIDAFLKRIPLESLEWLIRKK